MKRITSLAILPFLSLFLLSCSKSGKKDNNTDLLLGLMIADEIKYHCDPSENVRTSLPSSPQYTISAINPSYSVYDSAYQSGIGTIYLNGYDSWTGLGRYNPMGILYASQNQTNSSAMMAGYWTAAGAFGESSINKDEGGGTYSSTTSFPVGSSPDYAAPGSGYDNFGTNSQLRTYMVTTASAITSSISGWKVINNIPQTCEEYKFRPEQGGVVGSSQTGLSKVWQSRKRLTIRFIEVNNGTSQVFTNPTFFTALVGSNALTARLIQIFGQPSVGIDLSFSYYVYDAASCGDVANGNRYEISDIFNDSATSPTSCSLAKLYTTSSAAQDPNALNVFFISELSSSVNPKLHDGLLGIAAGIPGLPGKIGTPKSGMAVFIENHRSSGVVGGNLSDTDLTFLANTIAHEGSHFLGLYHPVEIDQSSQVYVDPLPETPECRNPGTNGQITISGCLGSGFYNSGALNLMFPLGNASVNQSQLSGEQGWVLRSNPLAY
ncbi:pappalysin-1 domain protein [Leptospira fletcheri]|uniref:Pappalysin-1 domain protein n=1 Tax=Leptospira fletcheri TaxID=2484981 RepID=A0A4R9GGC6_9LEPT|nr:pappalysin-1 domain protein [Leptospira fletcheri]TGK11667.1 pappalysin-1 domain protein [Leptospira fletcheri]